MQLAGFWDSCFESNFIIGSSLWVRHLGKMSRYPSPLGRPFFCSVKGGETIMLDRHKYLSETECQKLLDFVRDKAKNGGSCKWKLRQAVVEVLLGCGTRASETRLLKIKHLDLNKEEPMLFIANGKGGKQRIVPISQTLRVVLKKFLVRKKEWGEPVGPEDWLFLSQLGTPFTLIGIQRMFKTVARKAGLKPMYSIHSIRHSYGFATYKASKNIRLCQVLLGHSSLSSTQIYAHVDPAEMVQIVNGLWT